MSSDNNTCIHLHIDKFPPDVFSSHVLAHGGLAFYIAIALYLFAALTLVTQAYLVSSLHHVADRLHIASYSGRNTITVPAILLPEFFIALISVFTEKGNITSATVIGSCAANSLLTVGAVGLVLIKPVKLSWYPIWRDNVFYSIAVTILLWTTYDKRMRWQECMFLFVVYLIYLLIIRFNHEVERGVRRIVLMYRTGDDDIQADIEIEKLSLLESRKIYASNYESQMNRRGSYTSQASYSNDMYCGCGDRNSKGNFFHNTGAIPEEPNTLELSVDAHDPAIDIEDPQDCICEENIDFHHSVTTNPSSFSEVAATTIFSSQQSLDSLPEHKSSDDYEHLPDSEQEQGCEQNNGGCYGSCSVTSSSNHIYKIDDDSTVTSSKNTISRFVRYTQQIFQPQNYTTGSYYLTLDMNHYVNGPSSPFSLPEKCFHKFLWIISLPAILVFNFTIPDCRKPKWKEWYPLTLLASTLWVCFITYILLWMAVEIGYAWKIPDAVMGFTFLALGLSFSKIVTTYFQSKAGYGFKAVYSIYGSNVFNLTINLGFVWLLASFVHNPYVLHSGSIVYINLSQLLIVLTPLLLQFTRWRLNKCLACIYLFLYGCFTLIVVLMEYNIIGNFNQKIC